MKKKEVTLSNNEVLGLTALVDAMSNVKHPFKLVTARNKKLLKDVNEKILDGRDDINHIHIKTDEEGAIVMKTAEAQETFSKEGKYSLDELDYLTSKEEYVEALNEYFSRDKTVDLYQVSLSKVVTVTVDGKKRDLTVADIIEDAELCDLTGRAIEMLLDVILVD